MPGIYEITCTQCSFDKRTSESSTWVTLRDGSQVPCPHPAEPQFAEERTGESWNALVRARRVHYRYALVCRDCGKCQARELIPIVDPSVGAVACPACSTGTLRMRMMAVS